MLPRQVTIESSLRSFQYKILNSILHLNEKLFKFKIVASPLCSLCKLHNETIIHLFSTCRVTLTLWEQLRSWISGTGILLPESMDPQTIILGAWNAKTPDFVIINHIILLFKRHIYPKRQNNHCINIFGIKNFIKHIERIEHKIDFNRDKLDTQYKKWDQLPPMLQGQDSLFIGQTTST